MLSALASGTLVRDPKSGTAASGTKWANTTIRANVGQNREGEAEAAFITIVCFGDVADRLARLAKGDAISVQGPLKPTEYQKDGETRHGLEIIAQALLSPYDLRKKRGNVDAHHQEQRPPQRGYGDQGQYPEFDDPVRC